MEIDAQAVHALAADMFWLFAQEVGVAEANRRVLGSEGMCLLEHRFDNELFLKHPIMDLADGDRLRFLHAVAREATTACEEERNLLGIIYLEDLVAGRSPDAGGIDTAPLKWIPSSWRSSHPLERTGSLCIRHPLPALVATSSLPESRLIEVADTQTALGFQMPLFLQITDAGQASADTYFLAGYFVIPVPNAQQGDRWNGAILNSLRTVSGMKFQTPEGEIELAFDWDSAPAGTRRSVFQSLKRLLG
ncbi:hypothetical protein [Sphingobium yanoikuyae]|uniref:Uncharacterized protein n=1 Tax=Sphingobium yanoikuyae TaxID=13690 RepID=A0A9X7YAV3_SPHYA|nr:hypothetical protein [Sphingobium yanoikuyae]QNG43508.1 hypothetical protein H3V42_16170 [Sphingobium yanoikuyae]